MGLSSSSSHSHIQPSLGAVGCRWSNSPPFLGMYRRKCRACAVPFSSVPSNLLSVYEFKRQSVTIWGGDQFRVSLALVSYVMSSFELYTCTRLPALNSTGCTLSSNWAFRRAASVSAAVYPCEHTKSVNVKWCTMSSCVVSVSLVLCSLSPVVSRRPHSSSHGVNPNAGSILSSMDHMASSKCSVHCAGIAMGSASSPSTSSRSGAHRCLR